MGRIRHECKQSCKQVHAEHNGSACLNLCGSMLLHAMRNMIPALAPLVPKPKNLR